MARPFSIVTGVTDNANAKAAARKEFVEIKTVKTAAKVTTPRLATDIRDRARAVANSYLIGRPDLLLVSLTSDLEHID